MKNSSKEGRCDLEIQMFYLIRGCSLFHVVLHHYPVQFYFTSANWCQTEAAHICENVRRNRNVSWRELNMWLK